jgi:hypothetical protein
MYVEYMYVLKKNTHYTDRFLGSERKYGRRTPKNILFRNIILEFMFHNILEKKQSCT